jgi:hypothetical protein
MLTNPVRMGSTPCDGAGAPERLLAEMAAGGDEDFSMTCSGTGRQKAAREQRICDLFWTPPPVQVRVV